MSARLDGDKKLKRTIRVHGIESDVYVILRPEGIEFRLPGTMSGIGASWQKVVGACFTPAKAKSFLEGKPLEFLQYQASIIVKKRIKRAEKKEQR